MSPPTGALALANGSSLAAQHGASFSLQLSGIEDLQRLARLFSASGLFGRSGNAEQHMAECAVKILSGAEAGFSPFASITGVTVINGRPAFGANLLAQAIKKHPRYDYRVITKTAEVCTVAFFEAGEKLGEETFTIQMAERASLIGKGGPWKQYPEAMLFARALTAGMRTHCPDALGGASAYTPEELGAQGQIDENGVVVATITEELPPHRTPQRTLSTPEELAAGARRACEARGMTPDGILALCQELSNGEATSLEALPLNILARLAKSGVSPQTAERCNAAGEALTVATDDEAPATWSDTDPTDTPQ